jgi:hypothetical protein
LRNGTPREPDHCYPRIGRRIEEQRVSELEIQRDEATPFVSARLNERLVSRAGKTLLRYRTDVMPADSSGAP